MACSAYENRLDELEDYLDGSLREDARAELERHLAGCAACREVLEEGRASGVLLREGLEPAPEATGAFWFRVLAGIRNGAGREDFWTSLEWLARRVAWSAGVAVLLLLGGVAAEENVRLRVLTRPAEAREIFPEPTQQPENNEEVLLTLAGNGNSNGNGR